MRVMQWVLLELKRLSRNRFASLAAGVIVLIPLLYSFLYLYSFWDPYAHLERMQVAVVNQDQAASKKDQVVSAGKDLVNKLQEDHSVGWEFTNEQDAFTGLNQSKYDLVIVIPEDFSQSILDTTKNPQAGKEIQKAKLLYYSNPSKNYLAEQIGNKVASKLEEDMNGQIAGNFLNKVFGSLDDMKSNLQSAAEGSSKLQDGIAQAYSGSDQLTQHLQEAAGGSDTLDQGLKSLNDGSAQVAQGNNDMAEGSKALHEGSKSIQSGVDSAYDGSAQLSNGSQDLVSGLKEANTSLQDAAQGSAQLYSGLTSAYSGSKDLEGGLYSAWTNQETGVPKLMNGANLLKMALAGDYSTIEVESGDSKLLQGVKQAHGGLQQVNQGVILAGNSLDQASTALTSMYSNLGAVITQLQQTRDAADTPEATKQSLDATIQQLQGIQAGLNPDNSDPSQSVTTLVKHVQAGLVGPSTDPAHPSASEGVLSIDAGLYNPADNLLDPQTLFGGLRSLSVGASQLADGTVQLQSGIGDAYAGSHALAQGLHDLTDGGAELSSGLASGAADFPKLMDGGKTLQDGINQLKQGLSDLRQGMTTFVGKLGDLVQGAVQLAEGSKTLNDGAIQAVNGSTSLHDGLVAMHDGSSSLTDGLSQAENGSQELTSGLKDGVDNLQQELPQNTAAVSKVMGQPVEMSETQIHPVKNYGTGFAPYFIPLSLWVGALMIFFLVNLKENTLQAAGVSRTKILLGKYATVALLGIIQAVASSLILTTILGLQPVNLFQFYGFNILQSLTYTAIIFLLVQLFDMAGRFIALVLLMLQLTSGSGTYPVMLSPEFFQYVHPYLPMTYGISALRQIISGSADIPLQTSVLILMAFGLGAILLAILLSPKRLRIKDLHPAPQLGE